MCARTTAYASHGRPMGLVFERVFRAAAAHVSETEEAEEAEEARSREASQVLTLLALLVQTHKY